jgi:hypothetical protein
MNETSPWPFLLEYGHGLFGSRAEAQDGYLGDMASEFGWIVFAADWAGMAQFDVPQALRLLAARFDEFAALPQRTQQGFAHFALLLRLMGSHAMAELPAMQGYDGRPLLSPSAHAAGARAATASLHAGTVFSFDQLATRKSTIYA